MFIFKLTDFKAHRKKKTHSSQQTASLTKIIDRKSLEDTGCVANKERAVVVSDSDNQRPTQAYHEVRHGKAEDENVHRLEERRVPQYHRYDETVVENGQHCVDEHEERKYAVAHPREDGGHHDYPLIVDGWRIRDGHGPRCAVSVHCVRMKLSSGETSRTCSRSAQLTTQRQ